MSTQKFAIITDSCCDLPYEYLTANDVDFISMTINLEGRELIDDLGKTFDYTAFIEEVKGGKMPLTSQLNISTLLEAFKPYVEQQKPLVYLALSANLSGSYNNALAAIEVLKEDYQEVPIVVIDSKAASLGEGLLVNELIRYRNEGVSLDEISTKLAVKIANVHSWVTVDDLAHLNRGGRISRTTAAVGSLIKVKPILIMDHEGKLANVSSVRGRKNSLKKIAEETINGIVEAEKQNIYIAYAGDLVAAEQVQGYLEEKIKVNSITILPMGPTISSHTGYGAIAVFSFGKKR